MFVRAIGGEYRLRDIRRYHWRKLAVELKLGPDKHFAAFPTVPASSRTKFPPVKPQMVSEGLKHPMISRLAEAVAKRAA